MTQFVSAPFPPIVQQQQAPRSRNEFNIGGRQNDDALLFALLQFMTNQNQSQFSQGLQEKQFKLERSLGERQIEESKRAEREARRIRLVTESQARFSRTFGKMAADTAVDFRKSALREIRRGEGSLKSFAERARVVQRSLRRSPHGAEAVADFQNFVQRFRDSVEEQVGQETNPLVKSGIATRFGEILVGLQQTAQEVGNADLFNLTDEVAFSSIGFQRFAGMQGQFIEDALAQRQAALLQDKNLRLEEIQQAISSFGDPDAPISEARARQITGDVMRRPLDLPGFDQLTFEEPGRPFRPVGDVPGQKGLGQELLEAPGEIAGAIQRGIGGTPGIQSGIPATVGSPSGGLFPFGPTFGPFPFPSEPGESPARFRPDQEPTPFTIPPSPNFGIDFQGPITSFQARPQAPAVDPFGPSTIPGFRGFGGF